MDSDAKAVPETLLSRGEIAIIDLGCNGLEPTPSLFKETAKKLELALSTNGSVFLVNHGIPEDRIQSTFKVWGTFCSLPDDVKDLYKKDSGVDITGYVPPGMEKADSSGKIEQRHCYNMLRFSQKMPAKEIPKFKETMHSLADDFINLSNHVMRALAIVLDLDPEIFLSFHKGMLKKDNNTTFRVQYYPPLGSDQPPNITRCAQHSDWGVFTFLVEDCEGGLEIFHDGEWCRVGHLPGGIIVIIGDLMEKWSSSKYKAVKHRVVIPEEPELRNRGRYSISYFVHPDYNTTADPTFFSQCRPGYKSEDNHVSDLTAYEYMHQKILEAYREDPVIA